MEERYFSQDGQDKFLDQCLFKKKRNGTFVEIGAHDGISFSNTFFFEKNRQWNGLCIEPIPERFSELKTNRNCITINGCISDKDGEVEFVQITGYSEMLSGIEELYDKKHLERIQNEINEYGGEIKRIKIKSYSLFNLIQKYNFKSIDYCSIDTEGSELLILKTLDLTKINVNVFSVENNYNFYKIRNFMKSAGYILINRVGNDDIFCRKDLIMPYSLRRYYYLIKSIKQVFSNIKSRIWKSIHW